MTPRYPLRLKLSIMAGAIAVVPLLIVGFMLININVTEVRTRIREYQIVVADDVAHAVGVELQSARTVLNAVSRVLTDDTLAPDSRLSLALAAVGADPTVDHVTIYDAQGKIIDTMREEATAVVPALDPLPDVITQRARETSIAVGQATLVDGQVRVLMVVQMLGDGEVTGYVASAVPIEQVQRRIKRLAETNFRDIQDPILLVDQSQRVLARGNPAAGPLLGKAKASSLLTGLGPAAARVGLSSSEDFISAEGVEMVGVSVWVPSLPWAVVVQQPRAGVYGVIDQIRRSVIAVIAGAILLALGVALFMARRISEPLRALTRFTEDLAARRFDQRITINTRDELALLGAALSGAAANLEESEAKIRHELAIRSDLGRYLPSDLVDKVVRREQDMGLGGRKTPISVLFADVVGFTPLTERLPPEEVVRVLNELFTILTEIVFRHGGTVDKFIGDSIMAIWGAPRTQLDHARLALRAAEDMMRWLEIGNAGWEEKYGLKLEIAIGVNSGEAVVGNIGSETRMEYTAIGDVVNVAARLEGIARPMQILVTEYTRKAAGDGFDYLPLGSRAVAGRREPVVIFEVRA
ncbi:MAG: adenylate cyclase [Bradymonadia bacterium]|jgi:adenylate cyclase